MGKVYTSYFSKVKDYDSEKVVLISISRSTPKYIQEKCKYFSFLAPPWRIINKWKASKQTDYDWDDYKSEYLGMIRDNYIDLNTLKSRLEDMAKDKNVILLCHESPVKYGQKDNKRYCHRFILSDELNKLKMDIKEI